MKKSNSTKCLNIVFAFLLLSYHPLSGYANFQDVPATHEYHSSINTLVKAGCISGYADKTFKPNNTINRAETLKLIINCLPLPKIYTEEIFSLPKGTSYSINSQEIILNEDSELKIKVPFIGSRYPDLEFIDLNQKAWYVDTLKEGLVREIITGYADNTIKAERTVTKGEFFTMLHRIVPKELQEVDLSKNIANDAIIGQWFSPGLGFAVQNKIIGLNSENKLSPFKDLNRGQVAHFILLYKNWLQSKTNNQSETPPSASLDNKPQENPTPTDTNQSAEPNANTNNTEFVSKGIASFMGQGIAGKKTASGDAYDPEARTAAHWSLPFGTLVKVLNVKTQKWTTVRINDRGPNPEKHPDRIIDLSYRAFGEIANIEEGVVEVEIELVQ